MSGKLQSRRCYTVSAVTEPLKPLTDEGLGHESDAAVHVDAPGGFKATSGSRFNSALSCLITLQVGIFQYVLDTNVVDDLEHHWHVD